MKKQYKYLIGAAAVLLIAAGGLYFTKGGSSSISNIFKPKAPEATPFGISQKAVFFYPFVTADKPHFYDDITVVIGNTTHSTDDERRIAKASVENIKVIKAPKVGGYNLYRPADDPQVTNAFDAKYNVTNAKRFDINVIPQNANTEFKPNTIAELGGIVHLYYRSNDFKPVTTKTVDFKEAMKQLGITNDSLKSKIAFDLQVTNKKNETFVKHLEFDLPVSNIFDSKAYSQNSKLVNVDTNMFIKK